jgi:hypothetical protein
MELGSIEGAIELGADEAQLISGGYIQVALYLTACFKAGFYFGFYELGPML